MREKNEVLEHLLWEEVDNVLTPELIQHIMAAMTSYGEERETRISDKDQTRGES